MWRPGCVAGGSLYILLGRTSRIIDEERKRRAEGERKRVGYGKGVADGEVRWRRAMGGNIEFGRRAPTSRAGSAYLKFKRYSSIVSVH